MRTRFGTAAKHRVEEEYSAARMTADYLRVYAEAIEGVGKGEDISMGTSAASRGNAK